MQLLPTGKSGKLKDSILLSVYECTGNNAHRIYSRVDRIRRTKSGQPVRFVAQVLNADPSSEYYCLIAGTKEKKSFTVRTTQEFKVNRFRSIDLGHVRDGSGDVLLGRVTDENGVPIEGQSIKLMNEAQDVILSAESDVNGEFKFEKLPVEQTFIAELVEPDAGLTLDMYRYGEDGERKNRAEALGNNTYGFGDDKKSFKDLELLSRLDYAIYPEENKIGLAGRIVDQETFLYGQDGLEIALLDNHRNELTTTVTDKDGRFSFNNLDKGNYTIRVEDARSDHYTEIVMVDDQNVPFEFTSSNNMNADGSFKFSKLPHEEVRMQRMIEEEFESDDTDFTKLSSGQSVILKHVYFESGQSDLLENSNLELDELTAYLNQHANLKVKVSGHTDNTGSSALNQKLSEDRAHSVFNYLVAKGIDSQRVSYTGYGKSKHIVSNINEKGRSQNRRVEIEVVQ